MPHIKRRFNMTEITVGVRYHDPKQFDLLKRCLIGISGQTGVKVNLILAVQGFSQKDEQSTAAFCKCHLSGSGFDFEILNIDNPESKDMRAALLNKIINHHYNHEMGDYLIFIDFDDIWFQNALETLAKPLMLGDFAVSYADIHCADVYYDNGQVYLRGIKDVFGINRKFKCDLKKNNFLPLHSYMFHTGRIDRSKLYYDESLERLEDYDVLLNIARNYSISGMYRKQVIGLYNFYTLSQGMGNSTPNIFQPNAGNKKDHKWTDAHHKILLRHLGKPWKDFYGEELDAW